jgi:hypothetical protein
MNKLTMVAVALVSMSGFALAGDAKDPKAGAPKADAPKAGAPAPKADAPKAGDMKMEMKPPQELADMAKTMTGTWKCSGKVLGMDMKTMQDMTATAKLKLDMDGYWMHLTYDSKMGKMPFHFEEFTTYDTMSKQWRRVMLENNGGQNIGTSTGPKDNKMDWELATTGMMGQGMFKDHEDWTDLKAGFKSWGEMSMDKGKTWTKVYEQTCKK